MADFLEEKRKEIQQRLDELSRWSTSTADSRPPSARSPASTDGGRRGDAAPARGPARPARERGERRQRWRPARPPKGSGTRAVQALELVRARPGITIPELAEAMGIKQNYLYRVMPTLADEGQIVKSGRGWHAR